jgi:branched-subunit amino acid transport protein AzlD
MDLFSIFKFNLQSGVSEEDGEAGVYEDLAAEAPDKPDDTVMGMPLITDEFYELMFRFGFSLLVLFIIIRLIYYPTTKRKDYLFTYLLISVITFFICYTLQNNKIKLGLALGLFAVFGIIRYRTDAIAIKEMTYLFMVIGLSVINALSNDKVSWAELIFTNFAVIAIVYGLEKIWLLKHEHSKVILYEKIELIKPDRRADLKKDLEERTGLKINRISIGKIDFLRDTAQVIVFYFEPDQPFSDPDAKSDDDDD